MSHFPEDKSYLILAYAQARRQGAQAFRDGKAESDCPHAGLCAFIGSAAFTQLQTINPPKPRKTKRKLHRRLIALAALCRPSWRSASPPNRA